VHISVFINKQNISRVKQLLYRIKAPFGNISGVMLKVKNDIVKEIFLDQLICDGIFIIYVDLFIKLGIYLGFGSIVMIEGADRYVGFSADILNRRIVKSMFVK
jgi:hypothetical protein